MDYPGLTVQATGIFTRAQNDGGLFPFWHYKTEFLLMLVSEGFRKYNDGTN
jgi:hypothetical protein